MASQDNASRLTMATARRRPYEAPTLIKRPALTAITAAKSVSSAAVACWVARAAFGEADLRWHLFRAWLLEDAPAWFRAGYLRHGEMVGAWLARRDRLRAVVRAIMMPAVRRKLRS